MTAAPAFGVFTTPSKQQSQRWLDGSDAWFPAHFAAPDQVLPRAAHCPDGIVATAAVGDRQVLAWITMERFGDSPQDRRFGVWRCVAVEPDQAIVGAEALCALLRALPWRQASWCPEPAAVAAITGDAAAAGAVLGWLCALLAAAATRGGAHHAALGAQGLDLTATVRLALWGSRFLAAGADGVAGGRIAVLPAAAAARDDGAFAARWDALLVVGADHGHRALVPATHCRGVELAAVAADLQAHDVARMWARPPSAGLPPADRLGLPLRWLDAGALGDEDWSEQLARLHAGCDLAAAPRIATSLAAAAADDRLATMALHLAGTTAGDHAARALLPRLGVAAGAIDRLDAVCAARRTA